MVKYPSVFYIRAYLNIRTDFTKYIRISDFVENNWKNQKYLKIEFSFDAFYSLATSLGFISERPQGPQPLIISYNIMANEYTSPFCDPNWLNEFSFLLELLEVPPPRNDSLDIAVTTEAKLVLECLKLTWRRKNSGAFHKSWYSVYPYFWKRDSPALNCLNPKSEICKTHLESNLRF